MTKLTVTEARAALIAEHHCDCDMCVAEKIEGLPAGSLTPENEEDLNSVFRILGKPETGNPDDIQGSTKLSDEDQAQGFIESGTVDQVIQNFIEENNGQPLNMNKEEIALFLAKSYNKGEHPATVMSNLRITLGLVPNAAAVPIDEVPQNILGMIFGGKPGEGQSVIMSGDNIDELPAELKAFLQNIGVLDSPKVEDFPVETLVTAAQSDVYANAILSAGLAGTPADAKLMADVMAVLLKLLGKGNDLDIALHILQHLEHEGFRLTRKEELTPSDALLN